MITDIIDEYGEGFARRVVVTEVLDEHDLRELPEMPRVGGTLVGWPPGSAVVRTSEFAALREFVQNIAQDYAGGAPEEVIRAAIAGSADPVGMAMQLIKRDRQFMQQRASSALRNPAGPTRDTVLEAACEAWWDVECVSGEEWDAETMRTCDCPGKCEGTNPTCEGINRRNEVRARVRALLAAGALESPTERKARTLGPCRGDALALKVGLRLWGLAGRREERETRRVAQGIHALSPDELRERVHAELNRRFRGRMVTTGLREEVTQVTRELVERFSDERIERDRVSVTVDPRDPTRVNITITEPRP